MYVFSARKRSEIDETVGSLAGAGPSGVRISEGGRITGLVCDVREHTQVKALFERTTGNLAASTFSLTTQALEYFRQLRKCRPRISALFLRQISLAFTTAAMKQSR